MKVKVLVDMEMDHEEAASLGIRSKKELVSYFCSCIDFRNGRCDVLYPVRNGTKNPQEAY